MYSVQAASLSLEERVDRSDVAFVRIVRLSSASTGKIPNDFKATREQFESRLPSISLPKPLFRFETVKPTRSD